MKNMCLSSKISDINRVLSKQCVFSVENNQMLFRYMVRFVWSNNSIREILEGHYN